eukprot:jgi/Bigna1/64823/fgenesh1_kg.86_\
MLPHLDHTPSSPTRVETRVGGGRDADKPSSSQQHATWEGKLAPLSTTPGYSPQSHVNNSRPSTRASNMSRLSLNIGGGSDDNRSDGNKNAGDGAVAATSHQATAPTVENTVHSAVKTNDMSSADQSSKSMIYHRDDSTSHSSTISGVNHGEMGLSQPSSSPTSNIAVLRRAYSYARTSSVKDEMYFARAEEFLKKLDKEFRERKAVLEEELEQYRQSLEMKRAAASNEDKRNELVLENIRLGEELSRLRDTIKINDNVEKENRRLIYEIGRVKKTSAVTLRLSKRTQSELHAQVEHILADFL